MMPTPIRHKMTGIASVVLALCVVGVVILAKGVGNAYLGGRGTVKTVGISMGMVKRLQIVTDVGSYVGPKGPLVEPHQACDPV